MSSKGTRADIKIIVIGNAGTGKTCFCRKWMKDEFTEGYKQTLVVDFSYKIYEYKGYKYKVQLWDIGGQDKNIHIIKTFSRNVNGALILCDITDENSLQETLKWKKALDDSEKFVDDLSIPAVLVQNKIDLVDESTRNNMERIRQFQTQNEFINFFRTSVKMNINIQETMNYLIETIIDRMENFSLKEGIPFGQKQDIAVKHKDNMKLDLTKVLSSRKTDRRYNNSKGNSNTNNNGNNNGGLFGIGNYADNCCY